MVTRVYGTVEGAEVILTPSTGDQWTCTIPKTLNGEYVVELFAEDEAGNIAYFASALFEVDAKHVHVSFRFPNYTVDPNTTRIHSTVSMRSYGMRMLKCEAG